MTSQAMIETVRLKEEPFDDPSENEGLATTGEYNVTQTDLTDIVEIGVVPVLHDVHVMVDELLEDFGLTTVRKVKVPKGKAKKKNTVEETKIYLNTRRVYLNGDLWKSIRSRLGKFYGTHLKSGMYIDDILYGLLSNNINVTPFLRYHCIWDKRTHKNNFEDGVIPEGYSEAEGYAVFSKLMRGLRMLEGLDYSEIHTIRRSGFGKNYYDIDNGVAPALTDFELESIFPESTGLDVGDKEMSELEGSLGNNL